MIVLHEPMTTKTKKPSSSGPTGQSFPFLEVVSGTNPLLVMFFSNFSTFLSAKRLDVVYTKPQIPDFEFQLTIQKSNKQNQSTRFAQHSITQGGKARLDLDLDGTRSGPKANETPQSPAINNQKMQELIRRINNNQITIRTLG